MPTTDDENRKFIKEVVLFKELPEAQIDKVTKLCTEKKFPKYHVIFEEGERGDSLFIVKQGLVKISKEAADGRVKTLALFQKSDFFGEMSVLSEDGRSANAETLTETRVLILDREGFINLLNKNPSISLHIIHTLIDRLALADRQIKNLALGNSRAKIADILIQLAREFGDGDEKLKKVNVRLTHQELADLAGLARETTTKLLNEFVKDEAIQLADREIEILDPDKLAKWTM